MQATLNDSTLETLIPRPSRARNFILIVLGALILAAVLVGPMLLQSSISKDSSGTRSWAALGPHPFVLSVVSVKADGWPSVKVDSVTNVPGASVADVWIMPEGTRGENGDIRSAANFAHPWEYVEAYYGATADNRLPQQLDDGESASMLILWEIEDCELLNQTDQPEVRLKTLFRTTVTESLSQDPVYDFVSPAFDIETLIESGTCPQ